MKRKKRILVAALHWGLGHATRCMPLIEALLQQGAEPVLASDGAALQLWKAEYPQLQHIELPAYDIRYDSAQMVWAMAKQLPRMGKGMYLERKALARIVKKHKIDALICDNRFGLWLPSLPSVFISHQLHIRVPALLRPLVRRLNHYFIQRHQQCWIPDFEGPQNLAAELSHPPLPNAHYLGPLSRFEALDLPIKYRLIVVLSGPEPQRSKLEQVLLQQLKHFSEPLCLVRGRLEAVDLVDVPEQIEVYNYCTASQLNRLICSSQFVICRSGYSTLMDLAVLGKAALLIPTPGQTEQEYLADRAAALGQHVQQKQQGIDLRIALEALPHCQPLQLRPKRGWPLLEAWLAGLG